MDRLPVEPSRRKRFEAFIRFIDLLAYGAVFAGGIYALVATPVTVSDELANTGLIYLWAGLLLVGGAAGFVGRLTRFWFPELPATVLSFAGILIYFVVLGRYTFTSITAAVAAALVLVSMLVMARRWAELQIFATDPEARDLRTRLADALRRRTQNFVQRDQ